MVAVAVAVAVMLAVVPARGGSKGIPRKNLRMVAGKPLLAHIVGTLTQVEGLRVVVSTEDAEIAGWCRVRGVEVVDRPEGLAGDDVTVRAVAQDAARALGWGRPVMVAQPTCPLLSADTIRAAIAEFDHADADLLVGVTSQVHQLWRHDERVTPNWNRQTLFGDGYRTGTGLTIWRRFDKGPCYGGTVPFLVPDDEALDIDTLGDLEAARGALGRRRIHIRVNVGPGLGHLHRALVLAEHLDHHELRVSFWRNGFEWSPGTDLGPLGDRLASFATAPDDGIVSHLVLSDTLATSDYVIHGARSVGTRWVALEDRGPGSDAADLVVNELYVDDRPNAVCGPRWAVLRPEFVDLPAYQVREDAKRVLVLFGGNDEHSLTDWAKEALWWSAAGTGTSKSELRWTQVDDYRSVAEAMLDADVLVTSCGRTVNEAAAVGIPTIAIAANQRETGHVHIDGVIYGGLHVTVSGSWLAETVRGLLARPDLRGEISGRMRSQVDGLGAQRIARRVDDLLAGIT